jgi:hypothetical protein
MYQFTCAGLVGIGVGVGEATGPTDPDGDGEGEATGVAEDTGAAEPVTLG